MYNKISKAMLTIYQHFRNNVAVIVKPGPTQENTKTVFVVVLSDEVTKNKRISMYCVNYIYSVLVMSSY